MRPVLGTPDIEIVQGPRGNITAGGLHAGAVEDPKCREVDYSNMKLSLQG